MKPPSNQPKPLKTYKNRYGTMKNQSGTIKTNLELDRVVMGGSGGYRRLPGGSAHFSLQTNRQTLHHNLYIIMVKLISVLHQNAASLVTTRAAHNGPDQVLKAFDSKK